MNVSDVKNDPKILRWFDNFELSKHTREIYTNYMEKFCLCCNKTPTELIQEAIKEIKSGLMPSERVIGEYVFLYKKYLKEKNFAEKSQATAIACVKSFFKAYDIPLPSDVRIPKKPVAYKENQTPLTKADVKKLITNTKNLRDKAIILLMATSGMARREIRTLRMRNMVFDESGITMFDVFREKTKTDYITFGSVEATKAIKDYLDERNRHDKIKVKGQDDYVFVTYLDSKYGKASEQIDDRTFSHIFWELADELGYKNGDYFIKTRSHALRSFFSTTLENAGCPKSKVDFMLGHARSGTDLAYFHPDRDLLKQLYIDYLPYLSFEAIPVIKSLKTEDEERLNALEIENEKLKAEIQGTFDKRDKEIEELKKQMLETISFQKRQVQMIETFTSLMPTDINDPEFVFSEPDEEKRKRILEFMRREIVETSKGKGIPSNIAVHMCDKCNAEFEKQWDDVNDAIRYVQVHDNCGGNIRYLRLKDMIEIIKNK